MENENLEILKYNYSDKLNILDKIRREIKKKRFILDENVNKFGFDDLSQLAKVKNTSQVKGYPFVASKITSKILKGVKLGLKVMPIEIKYDKHEHPSNLEIITLKELTDNLVCKGICPHIVYYIGSQKVLNKSRALKFLNLKRLEVEEQIKTHSNLLISEYIEGGSLDDWVYNLYENDQEVSNEQWKILVFQITYTLAILQKYYKMMHNDLHYGNILIDTKIKSGGYFVYTIKNKTFYIPNTGIMPYGWDFEFTMIYSDKIPDFYPNKFIIGQCEFDRKTFIASDPIVKEDDSTVDSDDLNVPYNYNEVYDLHYFLTSLLDLYISQELFDWINKIYPEELIPKEDNSTNSTSTSNSSSASTSGSKSDSSSESWSDNSEKKSNEDENSDKDEKSNEDEKIDSIVSRFSSNSSSSSRSAYDPYLSEGRMKNGAENKFKNIPTPFTLLDSPLFEQFLVKPSDFDEKTAVYFKAGF